jgi:hypothetical protein
MKIYAGEGNIGHMVEHVKMYKNQVLWLLLKWLC